MKPARMFLLLHLCLAACVAAAQSPEQERHAEAKKLFPTLFSKCGEDYFSKRTFKYRSGIAWVIGQYREVVPRVKKQSLTRRDTAAGIEWKGNIRFEASAAREYPHGMQFPERGPNPQNKNDAWSNWKPPNLAAYMFLVEKKNGVISLKRRTPQELTAINCSEVPR
jgi:hypothetical protein